MDSISRCLKTSDALDDHNYTQRRVDIDNWLNNNWSTYSSSTVVVALDYFNTGNDNYGGAPNGFAGRKYNYTAWVDTYYEDNNDFGSEWQNVETSGVAQHELCHLFSADHVDASVTELSWGTNWTTLIWSPEHDPQCKPGTPYVVKQYHSSCAINIARNYIINENL